MPSRLLQVGNQRGGRRTEPSGQQAGALHCALPLGCGSHPGLGSPAVPSCRCSRAWARHTHAASNVCFYSDWFSTHLIPFKISPSTGICPLPRCGQNVRGNQCLQPCPWAGQGEAGGEGLPPCGGLGHPARKPGLQPTLHPTRTCHLRSGPPVDTTVHSPSHLQEIRECGHRPSTP